MKTKIVELKTLDKTNILDTAKEKISKLEDIAIKSIAKFQLTTQHLKQLSKQKKGLK